MTRAITACSLFTIAGGCLFLGEAPLSALALSASIAVAFMRVPG